MLKPDDRTTEGWAWLSGGPVRESLKLHARGAEPAPGRTSFYAPDFALNSAEPWLLGEPAEMPASALPLPGLKARGEPSPADFNRLFEDIQGRIRARELEKVVPMVCEELEFASPLDPRMFHVPDRPHQFRYGFALEGEGMIGQTPELLFAVEDGILQTMALAGTGKADGPSLLDDRKERHEHGLVVDHIAGEAAAWGEVEVAATEERAYGALKHLYTPIRVRLNEAPDFLRLVVRLHPTAALGGWPRRPAVEWLERQGFHESRRRFGAPFGFTDGRRMVCVVAIRGLQWQGARAQVSAGCGIVRESEVLKEWQELKLKREAVFRGLGLESVT